VSKDTAYSSITENEKHIKLHNPARIS